MINPSEPSQTTITVTTAGYPNQPPQNYVTAAQQHAAVPQTVPTAPPVQQEGWCMRNHRNKPQSNSVGPASLVFISGGMNIAWSFGYSGYINKFLDKHMISSWFIASIIGAIFAALVANKLKKKFSYIISSALVIVSGILFVSDYQSYDVVMVARYLNGFANGFVFVPCLVMIGEEAIKEQRGTLAASVETMCFALGMFLQILLAILWSSNNTNDFSFDVNQLHGILSIIYGSTALITTLLLFIESPVHHLLNNQEHEAIKSLRRLQRPHIVNQETYQQLEEHKRYINENQGMSFNESIIAGLPALLRLCIYRGLLALTYSLPINSAFMQVSVLALHSLEQLPFILFGTFRFVAALICAFVMDSAGRKKPMILSIIVCAGIAFGMGSIFDNYWNWLNMTKMETAMRLLIAFQIFAGIFGCASSAYLSEAFPLRAKPTLIACVFIVEMLVNILVIVCEVTFRDYANFLYVFGALGTSYCLFGYFCFPETMRTTLCEAQNKFRRLTNNI